MDNWDDLMLQIPSKTDTFPDEVWEAAIIQFKNELGESVKDVTLKIFNGIANEVCIYNSEGAMVLNGRSFCIIGTYKVGYLAVHEKYPVIMESLTNIMDKKGYMFIRKGPYFFLARKL